MLKQYYILYYNYNAASTDKRKFRNIQKELSLRRLLSWWSRSPEPPRRIYTLSSSNSTKSLTSLLSLSGCSCPMTVPPSSRSYALRCPASPNDLATFANLSLLFGSPLPSPSTAWPRCLPPMANYKDPYCLWAYPRNRLLHTSASSAPSPRNKWRGMFYGYCLSKKMLFFMSIWDRPWLSIWGPHRERKRYSYWLRI